MNSNLVNLPTELLDKIFGYVEKANDRRRVSQTCWTLYKVIRRQSKNHNTLYVTPAPVRVFKASTIFPFSKLHVRGGARDINKDRDFWQEHGQDITELTIGANICLDWHLLFPNLKNLTFKNIWQSKLEINENTPKIELPIEELSMGHFSSHKSVNGICYVLQSSPMLKNFELYFDGKCSKCLPDLLPWIESIENIKLTVERGISLNELLELPSKVVFQELKINSYENAEAFVSFFSTARVFEILCLELDLDEGSWYQFKTEKVPQLLKAKSVKKLKLFGDFPCFSEGLDLLAQIPGLEEIDIYLINYSPFREDWFQNHLHPHYWSNPNTASKIRKIEFPQFFPQDLSDLSCLSSIKIANLSVESLERLQNHPKLMELVIESFEITNVEIASISVLQDLEILEFGMIDESRIAWQWRSQWPTFDTLFKFPKLRKLIFRIRQLNNEIAILITENCPNLEELTLKIYKNNDAEDANQDSNNDDYLDHLIRTLPYLKMIRIYNGNRHFSEEKNQALKKEFPYLQINGF